MPLNTASIAQMMGTPVRIYHEDFTHAPSFIHAAHVNLPEMVMKDTSEEILDRFVQRDENGLHIEFTRPEIDGPVGVFAVLPLATQTLQSLPQFMITARFQRPHQRILPQGEDGTFAPALLMTTAEGDLIGLTSQFRIEGQRLNVLGADLEAPRGYISTTFTDALMNVQDAAILTLIFWMHRESAEPWGRAMLYVGDELADEVYFYFLPEMFTKETSIADLRVGLGTANGFKYNVSVNVLTFEVWVTEATQVNNTLGADLNALEFGQNQFNNDYQ